MQSNEMIRATTALLLLATASAANPIATASAANPTPPHATAAAACAAMNVSQLIGIMHGYGAIAGYSRNSGCNNECGRATFRWDNGPQGFGDRSPAGKSTQWPSTLNMAASFDPVLAGEWGRAMGQEFWAKGTNIQEGPGVNIARIENNGRTFEYLSGEDPVLGAVLVQPLVEGIQQHVMAISKHYILNNQETDRSGVNEIVDEKTIMELYAPPFGAAAAKTAGYMCAYNRINGVWACENGHTLKTILKTYYNFSGFVVSDWGACHSTVGSLQGGLDIEMPSPRNFNEPAIRAALANKSTGLTEDRLRDSCLRIMSGWFNLPADKRYPCNGGNCILNNVSSPENKKLARKISAQTTVLVKNDHNLLPLDSKSRKHQKIVLIGPDADKPYVSGQGSGGVSDSNMLVSPLAAFKARGVDVTYEPANTVLHVGGRTISFTVTGGAGGCETPQVYLSYPTAGTDPEVPAKVLRYFEKVCGPVTEQVVSYTLTDLQELLQRKLVVAANQLPVPLQAMLHLSGITPRESL